MIRGLDDALLATAGDIFNSAVSEQACAAPNGLKHAHTLVPNPHRSQARGCPVACTITTASEGKRWECGLGRVAVTVSLQRFALEEHLWALDNHILPEPRYHILDSQLTRVSVSACIA